MKPKRTDQPARQPEAKPAPAKPPPPVDLDESVAGEEDPGASLDTAVGSPSPEPRKKDR